MWYKNVGTYFFNFVTNHAFDRQTESYLSRSYSALAFPCSAVKSYDALD